jgi:uncharacterized membrane protein/glutaredoxin
MLSNNSPKLSNQWSNPTIFILAVCGAILTSYLTVTHFAGSSPAFCDAAAGSGCDLVLGSAYAKVFDLPLTLFGALTYLAIASLAAVPMLFKSSDAKNSASLQQTCSFWLFLISTAGLLFSGYLMYLLAFVLSATHAQSIFCIYCIASAVTMTSIWLCNLLGNSWQDWGKLGFSGFLIAVITLTATAGVYATQSRVEAQSQTFTGGLALHLKDKGFKMYGAFWCPHCQEQKAMFGDASAMVPYIECDARAANAKAELCQQKRITSYPTWEVDGKFYEGVQSLSGLADLSKFSPAN